MSSRASIGIIPTESMRGVAPDEELNKYSYFWTYLLSSDPINFTYRGEQIPNEQLRQWLDEYEAGTVFHIAGKDYIMSKSHTLDITYGEDIYDMRWPAKDFSSKKVKN